MIALSCTTVITVVQICIQRGLAAGVRYFILAHMYKIISFIWGGREGKEVTFHETFFFTNRVEDHDDLTPIFNRQSDVLTSTYGMLAQFVILIILIISVIIE